MSGERAIRINKVLRELNISLDRAVDYLKDKGYTIDASPNAKISGEERDVLYNQFSADKGKKEASLEVGEEKRKEKEALRIARERELEEKRKQEEEKEKLRQQQEVIKAKASLSGPVAVGKIDLKKDNKAQESSSDTANKKEEAKKEPAPEVKKPEAEQKPKQEEKKEQPARQEAPKAKQKKEEPKKE